MIDVVVHDGRGIENEIAVLYEEYLLECGVNCSQESVNSLIQGIVNNPSYFFIIAREARQLIGFIVGQHTISGALLRPAVYGQDLFVVPERRQGECSEALLCELYSHAKRSGAHRIFLNATRDKIRYFKLRGWRVENQALMYYDLH
jgi:Acetyltransferase (GNAT) domain